MTGVQTCALPISIHVRDVDEVRCEGCGEDGHIIWDCTKEYIIDDEWQCTTLPTTITHSSPSHSSGKTKIGKLVKLVEIL